MQVIQHQKRIKILDGFRAIAVLMVVLFHFYSRWTPPITPVNYYPYGNELSRYFHYGYFGVQFFFVISGFVIFYTLDKSDRMEDFWVKRFTRLFPALLICTIITYFFTIGADPSNTFSIFHPHTPLDFFPSLTFTQPFFWAWLFHNNAIEYINLSYWSLWVEVTFYLLCSLMFFANKQKFVRNWMLLLIPMTILKIISGLHQFGNLPYISAMLGIIAKFTVYFNFCEFASYSAVGILFYCLFSGKKLSAQSVMLCSLSLLVEMYMLHSYVLRLMTMAIVGLFMLFVYKPAYLSFLTNRILTRIGVISYSLYLFHENVGIILINKFASVVKSPVLVKIFPVFLLLAIILFSELLYRFYESPINNFFRKKLLSRIPKKKVDELQPK